MTFAYGKWAWVAVATVLVYASCRLYRRGESPALIVTFLDVGQGDAILLRLPAGGAWLVDAGGGMGEWDAGRREIFPELTSAGIIRLDTAVLSHPDQDHGYGFVGLLSEIPVDRFIVNGAVGLPTKALARRLVTLARLRSVPTEGIVSARIENRQGVKIALLPLSEGPRTNDFPLAVVAEYGGCAIWLGADSSSHTERRLLAAGRTLGLAPPTIWKLSHHGSRTSSAPDVVESARPRWAVVSAGTGNRYGHPVPAVVERWARIGAHVLRTDFHGYVGFTISREGIVQCRSAAGPCGTFDCGGQAAPR